MTRRKRTHLLTAAVMLTAVLISALMASPASAQTYEDLPEHLEERAQAMYSGIMCPQCSGQTISQSHAEVAVIMRDVIRERLLAGESDQEIIDYLVEAFGENVLADPPKSGASLAVWVIPPFALAAGAAAVLMAVRGLRRQRPAADAAGAGDTTDAELAAYLELVDEELSDGQSPPRDA